MITITSGGRVISDKSFVFSGGEIQVKLDTSRLLNSQDKVIFRANITSAKELFELALYVDAVDRHFLEKYYKKPNRELHMPYMPYARQDRVCAPGEALSLKVAADFINSMNFDVVIVSDPHSDVTTALLNNVRVLDLTYIFASRLHHLTPLGNTVLVSPDAGANKKVMKLAQNFEIPMVRADKLRDTNTGAITGTVVHADDLGDKDVLVVDDICDGGRTFTELASVLRYKTKGKLNLYVTHGIFSKGLGELLGWYDKIYCPYVFPDVEDNERLIRI